MTTDTTARVSGTIKAVADSLDQWANALQSGREVRPSIIGLRDMAKVVRAAAIQPDPEPVTSETPMLSPAEPQPVACPCICHRQPGVTHMVACCDQPPLDPWYPTGSAVPHTATPSSAGMGSVEAALPLELTAAQLDDACMSYRHDHGLLTAEQREDRRREAAEWWRCLRKTIAEPSAALRALAGERG